MIRHSVLLSETANRASEELQVQLEQFCASQCEANAVGRSLIYVSE